MLASLFWATDLLIMSLKSWGNFPNHPNTAIPLDHDTLDTIKPVLRSHSDVIAHGNGRSYGDSALNDFLIHTRSYNAILDFDAQHGVLHVQSGALLSDILSVIVPHGWFLKITPGTKQITIGGAIASDIHGKNHHIEGCFSTCIINFQLLLPNGNIKQCSLDENTDLFQATCGGMGLTGLILDTKISLRPIKSSFIKQCTIKTNDLNDTFNIFETHNNTSYSVAWLDCFLSKNKIGRGLVMLGEFSDQHTLQLPKNNIKNIPFFWHPSLLNNYTIKLFNYCYYQRYFQRESFNTVSYETFFYPLDKLHRWNQLYGKNGFIQYQFILPKDQSLAGIRHILNEIASQTIKPYLAVLKLYGKENKNYLSFPLEGYSLALDFKIQPGLFAFLDKLDTLVLMYKGRLYLSKDARMSKTTFEKGYPKVTLFRNIRQSYNLNSTFNSLQSKRLHL